MTVFLPLVTRIPKIMPFPKLLYKPFFARTVADISKKRTFVHSVRLWILLPIFYKHDFHSPKFERTTANNSAR